MNLNFNINQIFFLTYLFFVCSAIQLQLTSPQTCLDYVVSQPNSIKVFYFHYNHNYDNINMILYYRHVKQIMQQTGFGFQYKTSLQVEYKQSGTYTLCFLKKSQGTADVSFQIVDQQKMSMYAGKEQIAKLSKRISQFLMDIKKVGWSFRQVLQQHNKRKQTITDQQNSYGYLLALKTAVMIAIVALQILVIKKIFK